MPEEIREENIPYRGTIIPQSSPRMAIRQQPGLEELTERPMDIIPEAPMERPAEIPKQGKILTPEDQNLKNALKGYAQRGDRKGFDALKNRILIERDLKGKEPKAPHRDWEEFTDPKTGKVMKQRIEWDAKTKNYKKVGEPVPRTEEKKLTDTEIDRMYAQYRIAKVKAKNDPMRAILATALANQGVAIDPYAEWPDFTKEQFRTYIRGETPIGKEEEMPKPPKLSPKIQKEYDLATKNIKERPEAAEAIKKEYKRRTRMDYK